MGAPGRAVIAARWAPAARWEPRTRMVCIFARWCGERQPRRECCNAAGTAQRHPSRSLLPTAASPRLRRTCLEQRKTWPNLDSACNKAIAAPGGMIRAPTRCRAACRLSKALQWRANRVYVPIMPPCMAAARPQPGTGAEERARAVTLRRRPRSNGGLLGAARAREGVFSWFLFLRRPNTGAEGRDGVLQS